MNSFTGSVRNYFSLVRFSHTFFAMPFALIGFTLGVTRGNEHFSFRLLLLIILCMVFARNAAMGFNRIADQRYDALNPRTKSREIPAGKISTGAATVFVIINCILFIVTAGFINRLTFFLSPAALLVILGYSLTKRFTSLCHFILGLGLSLAPIGAYISVTGYFALLPVLYSFIVLTWVSAFDIIYSLMDDSFDKYNDLFSIPAAVGIRRAILISILIHLLTLLLIVLAGVAGNGGFFFWTGALIFTSLLVYQHLIVKPDDLSRVNVAFFNMNSYIAVTLLVGTFAALYV